MDTNRPKWGLPLALCLVLLVLTAPVRPARASDMGEIHSGQTRTGTLTNENKIDTFTFYGEAGQGVVIQMTTTSSGLYPYIKLYRPDGTLEAYAWYNGESVLLRDHQLEQSGTYTLAATGHYSYVGNYGLSLLLIPGATSSQQDPDGGSIASGQTHSGTIEPAGDMDAFVFYGQAGQGVVVQMATDSTLWLYVQLYRPDGTLEAYRSFNGESVLLADHRLEQSGRYTLVATGRYLGHLVGTYGLSLVLAPGATSSWQDRDGGDIASGQTYTGTVGPVGDTDAFAFYGEAGQAVTVRMTTDGRLWPYVQLYRPDGTLETYSWYNGSAVTISDHVLEQSGRYTIVACGHYVPHLVGPYSLSLTQVPPDPAPGVYAPSPANGATVFDLGQDLAWSAVEGATAYDLYLGTGVTVPLEKVGEGLVQPLMPFPELEVDCVYYWHVETHTPEGAVQGPYWWFQTRRGRFTYLPLVMRGE